jgi:hypothetical protein
MAPRTLSIAAALAALLAAPSFALSAEEKSGRYTMSPVEDGFVRLDTETGEMSFCKRGGDGSWACHPMADSPGPKGEPGIPPSGALPDAPAPDSSPNGKFQIPTEEDVDKLFDYVERMTKKLKERLKRLEEQDKPSTPL